MEEFLRKHLTPEELDLLAGKFDKTKLNDIDKVTKKTLEIIKTNREEIYNLSNIGELIELYQGIKTFREIFFD